MEGLPPELEYLSEVLEQYGRIGGEGEICDFLHLADTQTLAKLQAIGDRIRMMGHLKSINQFMDAHPIDKNETSARLYFLLLLLDHADMLE